MVKGERVHSIRSSRSSSAGGRRRRTTARQALMSPAAVKTLPDNFTKGQINLSMAWWAENRDVVAKRWYAWQAQ